MLKQKGHFAECLATDNIFQHFGVVFREGHQAFSEYAMRGIQLDGTFLKHKTGGVLLVACFKDANSNIRIVGVAVVASETTNTWSWFLQFLKDKLVVEPSFIVYDRDK